MKDSKSPTLVDEDEPSQTVDASTTIVTAKKPAALGDQGAQPSTLKHTPTTKRKPSKKSSKAKI